MILSPLTPPPSLGWLLLVLLGGFVFAAALVNAAIRYSASRGLLDAPGRRTCHAAPTPRGGGVGVVVAFLAGLKLLVLFERVSLRLGLSLAIGLLAVAAIGWLDDHRPQPALRRLLVHAVSSVLIAWALLGWPITVFDAAQFGLAILVLMTAINFANFMDGSNGMLTIQSMAIAALLMLLAVSLSEWPLALLSALMVGTSAGLLPFNFPQAKIFMGDVGSGSLGLLIGAITVAVGTAYGSSLVPVLIASSALWLDAGLTLALRLLTGRRWYEAHRSHLFQWLIRRGYSHAKVAYAYLAWTLLVSAPLVLSAQAGWLHELVGLGMVTALGAAVWRWSRLALVAQVRASRRAPHAHVLKTVESSRES